MYAPIVTRLDTYQLPVPPGTRTYMDAVLALPAFQQWRGEAFAEPWRIAHYEEGHSVDEAFLPMT